MGRDKKERREEPKIGKGERKEKRRRYNEQPDEGERRGRGREK